MSFTDFGSLQTQINFHSSSSTSISLFFFLISFSSPVSDFLFEEDDPLFPSLIGEILEEQFLESEEEEVLEVMEEELLEVMELEEEDLEVMELEEELLEVMESEEEVLGIGFVGVSLDEGFE